MNRNIMNNYKFVFILRQIREKKTIIKTNYHK
jgi:hypothetical protein